MEMEIEKKVNNLKILIQGLESRVQDLETIRDPNNIHGKIDHLFSEIESMTNSISEVMNKINSFANDEKFIELFKDGEIKELYFNSGLTTEDVKKFIEKNLVRNEAVSLSTVSRYVNGHIEDLTNRSKLGKFLRYSYVKNRKNKK